eukprot:TRINITY_DN3979_c0_g1_i1.p1 TRINITY_DN3979_c0_g1~~TRINITY_DN3979_c0_g1_i1.p1  ORF type:complete len:390 (+),score=105.32 TRINITY_DN3979_c0_g1_i1:23-1171(+)
MSALSMKKWKTKAEKDLVYLAKKTIGGTSSFQHDAEIIERFNLLERIQATLTLQQNFIQISKINQELHKVEEDSSKAFHEKASSDSIGMVFTSLEFLTVKLSSCRLELTNELDSIVNEFNTLNTAVKQIFKLRELADKHLNDRNFFSSKGEKEKESLAIAEQKYQETRKQFISEMNNLEKQANELLKLWTDRILVAHLSFLKNTRDMIEPYVANTASEVISAQKEQKEAENEEGKENNAGQGEGLPLVGSVQARPLSRPDITIASPPVPSSSLKNPASATKRAPTVADLPPKPMDLPPKPMDLPPKPVDLPPKPMDTPPKPKDIPPVPREVEVEVEAEEEREEEWDVNENPFVERTVARKEKEIEMDGNPFADSDDDGNPFA